VGKIFKVLLGLALVVACGFAGVWGTERLMSLQASEGGQSGPSATRVGLASPERVEVEEDVKAVGTLRAIRMIELTPASAGRVTEVLVSSGDTVEAGQRLIQLDDRSQRAAVAEAEATLGEARSDFQRFEQLGDSNAAAEAQVEQARAAFLRAEAALGAAKAALEDRTVTAPFAGTLGLLDVEPGAFLSTETAVANLFDLSSVELEASLPERYFSRVQPGQTVVMSTPAFPDTTFEGEIEVKASEVSLGTRNFDIRATFENPDRQLVGGMFANARLVLDRYDATAIPDDAIISEGLSTYVFTVDDETARRTEVETGNSVGSLTEIREGLDTDDRVVVAGWDNLSDGATVEIDEDFEREALN